MWWSTAWGKLQPGDQVRAPDGSVWRVECSLEIADLPTEFQLRSMSGARAWSAHAPGDQVEADRPRAVASDDAVTLALFALRAGGLNPQPGAQRWIVSGGACNT